MEESHAVRDFGGSRVHRITHADSLIMRGNEVVIIDDLSSGRMQNPGHMLARDTVTFIQGSITDYDFLQFSFKGADGVFHLAALAPVPKSVTDPTWYPRDQRHRHVQRLSFCPGRRGPERFCASSVAIYQPVLPKREDMAPEPLSLYDAGKQMNASNGCTEPAHRRLVQGYREPGSTCDGRNHPCDPGREITRDQRMNFQAVPGSRL